MLVVAALGGNALLRRGEPLTIDVQARNAAVAAAALVPLTREYRVVLTHGNGPQVGLLALEQEGPGGTPLDVLGAQSQGMIGYLLESALRSALPGREVVTVLTQVAVDSFDPAFHHPEKPIGPVYTEAVARALAAQRGWTIAPDGDGFRRVVPSPVPRGIFQVPAIHALLEHELLVIAAGGGGVPIVVDNGQERGVEAVVDKDLTAALLASDLGADSLLLLTDVAAVFDGWGTEHPRALQSASTTWLRGQQFAPGSMGPKVEAACRFVERTGGFAAIGALEAASEILASEAGTRITLDGEVRYWPA